MMQRRRAARYPPRSGAATSDTDALQTDVMRFMAILGLCLVAVLALVQGIPVQDKGKSALPPQPAGLRQAVGLTQLKAQELRAAVQALKADLRRTRQELAVAERDLHRVSDQAREVRDTRERLEQQVAMLEQQLARGHRELEEIAQATSRKGQDLAMLGARLSTVQARFERSRQKLAMLKRQSRETGIDPAAGKTPAPAQAARPEPDRRGFTLRFVSDEALDRLVAAGHVSLYAMADKQAWRVSLQAGRTAVARGPYPGWFHEMSATTVPAHYVHALAMAADGPRESEVTWGVQLPAATRESIAALARGQQGGELVIRDDGRVVPGD